MQIPLSKYKTALNFEGRSGRNFADWLRTDRESNPIQVEGEIAYDPEFVRRSLRKRLNRIEKKYPESFQYVSEFVNGADLQKLSAKNIIKTVITQQHETTETEREVVNETGTTTEQAEPTPEHEIEPDVESDFGTDRIVQPEGMETETIGDRPEHETVSESNPVSDAPNAGELVVDPDETNAYTHTESKFRRILTNPETMLFGTVAVIFVFLPFTVLNLYQYINIETNSIWGDWGVFLLCCGIAFVWDISILLFAVNGKHRISQIGAGVLFVFMASKFDFFKRIFDLFGADGDWWQLMFVLSAIVFYSPVLIHQYTKLSVKDE